MSSESKATLFRRVLDALGKDPKAASPDEKLKAIIALVRTGGFSPDLIGRSLDVSPGYVLSIKSMVQREVPLARMPKPPAPSKTGSSASPKKAGASKASSKNGLAPAPDASKVTQKPKKASGSVSAKPGSARKKAKSKPSPSYASIGRAFNDDLVNAAEAIGVTPPSNLHDIEQVRHALERIKEVCARTDHDAPLFARTLYETRLKRLVRNQEVARRVARFKKPKRP